MIVSQADLRLGKVLLICFTMDVCNSLSWTWISTSNLPQKAISVHVVGLLLGETG